RGRRASAARRLLVEMDLVPVLRRRKGSLPPLLAALIAGAVVAGVALATDNAPSSKRTPAPRIASTTADSQAARGGLALQSAFVKVVRSVSPSVVQVEDQQGLGSGIAVDATGDIVTNNHVVSGGTSFTVTTSNGKRSGAKLVGAFPPDHPPVTKAPRHRRH